MSSYHESSRSLFFISSQFLIAPLIMKNSLRIFVIALFLSVNGAPTATLFCKQVWWFHEQMHCEIGERVDGRVMISDVRFYDSAEHKLRGMVVSYGKKSEHFPLGIGNFFTNLESLEISVNGLKFLYRSCFQNLTNLTSLSILHTEIVSLPRDVFYDLPNLEHLNIANNHLINLHDGLLWKSTKLLSFDASQNRLTGISENVFKNCNKLRVIDLQDNKLVNVRINFYLFENLTRLNLVNNLKTCDLTFGYEKSNVKKFDDLHDKVRKLCNF